MPASVAQVANTEWLEEMRRMWGYIERDNIILLIVELEFGRVVAIVAVED